MRMLRALAVPAAALLLTSGLTQVTATPAHAMAAPGTAAVVQAADTDSDDGDTGTLTNPTMATAVAPATMSTAGYSYTAPVDHCILYGYEIGATCYQWVGDDQWVVDGIANGWAAVVHVQTNYGKDRYCQALPSAQGWGKCNYDHVEGKCVRWQMYELKDGDTRNFTGWSAWYGTQYGYPC